MWNIDKVIDSFVSGDYFIIFLILTLAILVVLVLALIKSRGEYNELLNHEQDTRKQDDIIKEEAIKIDKKDEDILSGLNELVSTDKDDEIDENKPLIKQIDLSTVKTYDDVIDEYESFEEENAVISTDELAKRAQERLADLGETENQAVIAKYEEEQEKKAIISYEQLVKNASNITLSYKEEEKKEKNAPKINKIEVEREVTGPESYIAEEEFLAILKEFRVSLNENIFN